MLLLLWPCQVFYRAVPWHDAIVRFPEASPEVGSTLKNQRPKPPSFQRPKSKPQGVTFAAGVADPGNDGVGPEITVSISHEQYTDCTPM